VLEDFGAVRIPHNREVSVRSWRTFDTCLGENGFSYLTCATCSHEPFWLTVTFSVVQRVECYHKTVSYNPVHVYVILIGMV
jgi:hypothetical protein